MDTTASGIIFDSAGECNFCKLHDKLERQYPLNGLGKRKIERLIEKIKLSGKKNKYDCIIGVSGGRDSTYLLYLAKKVFGLRPLAAHFNDGFDNPVAGENIKNAVRKLGVELRTITSDWRESKEIRISFLKASVPNLEVGTDLGIFASLYGVAVTERVKYILTAHSFRTEGISPLTWNYVDGRYLKSVVSAFGKVYPVREPRPLTVCSVGHRLKSVAFSNGVNLRKWRPCDPGYNLGLTHLLYYIVIKGIRTVTPMYYIDYVRGEGEAIIKDELNWVNPGAHYFDDLWQSLLYYVYRVKFNVDKRKFNYSALIRSGQMKREEALERVKSIYAIEDPDIIDLCIKRLGITNKDIEEFMSYPPKTFFDYPTYYGFLKLFKFPIKLASRMQIIPAGSYDKFFNCI